MKLFKRIGIALLILIGIPLIMALFISNEYTISVNVTINKPVEQVMDFIKYLENQETYSEWIKQDPNLHPKITGIDGKVGAEQYWNSTNENVGEGKQTITKLTANRMDVDLQFIRPFEGTAKSAFILENFGQTKTVLTFEFYGKDKFPFNLLSLLFGRSIIKETSQKNLQNIKTIVETQSFSKSEE
jgi:hypothetical protein